MNLLLRILRVKTALPIIITLLLLSACNHNRQIVIDEYKQDNVLLKKIDILTPVNMDVSIRYWEKGNKDSGYIAKPSLNLQKHHFILTGLHPSSQYVYEISSTTERGVRAKTKRTFTTGEIPISIDNQVRLKTADTSRIPEKFKQGYILVYRRDVPGLIFILNAKGEIVWYHQLENTGFKVAEFTPQKNILALLAPISYPTSYSNEILSFTFTGDTLLDLKKGENGFRKTIHHEILLSDSGNLITLTVDKREFDLSKVGGTKKDTVTSDGILVMDKNGKKLWYWSVFDAINPLMVPGILQKKEDLTHANCLSYDNDGNYLISFYAIGQIWKVDAKTGKVIWKFGKDGDFKINNSKDWFQQSHAVQKINTNELLLFENGTNDKTSRVLTYRINENDKTTSLAKKITLPKNLYSPRMGSAYYVTDSVLLVCSAQTGKVVLVNNKGEVLWQLQTGFRPYRAMFIPHDSLSLFNLDYKNL